LIISNEQGGETRKAYASLRLIFACFHIFSFYLIKNQNIFFLSFVLFFEISMFNQWSSFSFVFFNGNYHFLFN
jgi:hypothetical protein